MEVAVIPNVPIAHGIGPPHFVVGLCKIVWMSFHDWILAGEIGADDSVIADIETLSRKVHGDPIQDALTSLTNG